MLTLKIVSPEKIEFDGAVKSVTLRKHRKKRKRKPKRKERLLRNRGKRTRNP